MADDEAARRRRETRLEQLVGMAVSGLVLWQAIDVVTNGRARLWASMTARRLRVALAPAAAEELAPAVVAELHTEARRIVAQATQEGGDGRG